MVKFLKEELSVLNVFTESEKKATLNTILMPLVLLLITSNLLISLCWILMLTVIYLTVQKAKTENSKMFFIFLKYETLCLLILGVLSLVFVVG